MTTPPNSPAAARIKAAMRPVVDWLAERIGIKSVSGYVIDYNVQLTRWITEVWDGKMSEVDLRRAHRELLKETAEGVYVEGMKDAGLSEAEALDALNDSDREKIGEWVKEQAAHVDQFAADVYAVRNEQANAPGAQAAIFARSDLWAAAVDTLGSFGRASVGGQRQMVTWRVGDTEHCPTCLELDGKRHRLDWFTGRGYIPRQNGSETLDCRGYQCQCGLFGDDGEQVL